MPKHTKERVPSMPNNDNKTFCKEAKKFGSVKNDSVGVKSLEKSGFRLGSK